MFKTRTQELADAWKISRAALINGTMGSLEHTRERLEILRQAKEEGLLDKVVKLVTG